MNPSSTLRIRNLPPALSNYEKTDLLKHFGALEVKCIGTKNPTAFAKFENQDAAKIALGRLHQLDILGYPLNVVYAHSQPQETKTPGDEKSRNEDKDTGHVSATEKAEDGAKRYEVFLQKLNAWSLGLDLTQPPPAHLRYQYPPPSVEVLANIARALCAVPKFYTQVLHLMNKMNLPSPFHAPCEEHSLAMARLLGQAAPQAGHVDEQQSSVFEENETLPNVVTELEMQLGSCTSESEMESEGESSRPKDIIPEKRLKVQKKIVKRSRLLPPRPLTTQSEKSRSTQAELSVDQVFEVAQRSEQKKIELILGATLGDEEERRSEKDISKSGFGVLFPPIPETVSEEDKGKEEELDGSYISRSQLGANRIPERDREVLSVYRGYQAGAPSCRLYVKNLSKAVTERDLHFIFRAFLGHKQKDEEANQMFDIRLMQEGRMKGQAFVTFPSVSQAQSALQETNGYLLKEKPMVVQFARSAKPKTSTE